MFEGLEEYISKNLQKKVTEKGYNDYQIFGKQVENLISDLIEEFLNENKIEYTSVRAKSKNEFPDLKLTIDNIDYAMEHKSGVSNDVANDMGTLNSYPEKIEKFGDRIFCTFVKYSKANKGKGIIIENIYFDKIYKFIGKMSNKDIDLLKYRLKDGNLRPKPWKDFDDGIVYTNTFKEFCEKIETTVSYRAYILVKQHIVDLKDEDEIDIYNRLKKSIESKSKIK